MNKTITIGGATIGEGQKPFIIAELSGNHQQSYDLALKMVEEAASAGANAIKLQTYTADSMTLDVDTPDFLIGEESSPWKGRKLHELYQTAATPYEWHKGLFEKAKGLGIVAFSSPFDENAVDFLEGLDVPCYKIASFENTDLPLIRRVAETGKPIIVSTGMASLQEIEEAVVTIQEAGCNDLILLKCTSTYPAPFDDTNLVTIPHMAKTFDCVVGLSDHSYGIGTSLAAVALGAKVVEKHFVLDRFAGGVDAAFSIEPSELKQLVEESGRVDSALGEVNYGCTESDRKARRYRRSLFIAEDLKKGDIVTENSLRIVRPGIGIAPKFFDAVIGKKVKFDVRKGTPVSWELF